MSVCLADRHLEIIEGAKPVDIPNGAIIIGGSNERQTCNRCGEQFDRADELIRHRRPGSSCAYLTSPISSPARSSAMSLRLAYVTSGDDSFD